MSQYSRSTLHQACTTLGSFFGTHQQFDELALRFELDALADHVAGGIRTRCLALLRYLRDNPDATHNGRNLWDLVIEEAVRVTANAPNHSEELIRSLERDGFRVVDGQIRRALPELVQLPEADDEVHDLLRRQGLTTPLGHIDQAIAAHARGDWAAANSQLRAFIESMLDEIAIVLGSPGTAQGQAGETRRQLLANLDPPFLSRQLNEWSDDGKNFVNGLFKRLHPMGAHPGLSDEEDCTFRLHVVLLAGRLFLRRLQGLRPK